MRSAAACRSLNVISGSRRLMGNQVRFWCSYCKRSRSGTRNSPESKTAEHFVPQSISGKWTIPICSECNSRLGATCDAYLAKVSWIEKLRRRGIIETSCIAVLADNSEVPALVKMQQLPAPSDQGLHVHWCRTRDSAKPIKKRELKAIIFSCEKMQAIGASYPAILKISLASIVYAAQRSRVYPSVKSLIEGSALDGARELFLARPINSHDPERRAAFEVALVSPRGCNQIQSAFQQPGVRRHFIQARQVNADIQIVIVLFSDFFWRVTFFNANLGVPELQADLPLHSHSRLDTELELGVVGGLMWVSSEMRMHVAVN